MQHITETNPDQGVDPFLELEELRGQAEAGEIDLATLRAIRLGCALSEARRDGESSLVPLEAEVLSDLAVLRNARSDFTGAGACARAALALVPDHETAARNLEELESEVRVPPEDRSQDPAPDMLNPWVRLALDLGEREVGFAGKHVLEVGGAVPEVHARATGAASWTGFYPGATPCNTPGYEVHSVDARVLPWADASFDVAFSSCAFEHIPELPRVFAEIRRVLRPGGVLVTSFAPVWSCAVGHHLWGRLADGYRVHFLDPIVPWFAHLLLDERELVWFLSLTHGAETGVRFGEFICRNQHVNRVFADEFRDIVVAAGFDDSRLEDQPAWNPGHVPGPALLAALKARHPGRRSFGSPGFQGVLSVGERRPRPVAPSSAPTCSVQGRTIYIGGRP